MSQPLICSDNAVIRIGFEVPRYTYMEPDFETDIIPNAFVPPTNLTANGPIYLAKEDNVQSEQTFRIIVQVADSVPSHENINPATRDIDYSLGPGGTASSVVEFFPFVQRVNFPFTLIPDAFTEGTEAFRVSSTAEDDVELNGMMVNLPEYTPPIALSAETFVIIEDDDRKAHCGYIIVDYS